MVPIKQHLFSKPLLCISFLLLSFLVFTQSARAAKTEIAVAPAIIETGVIIGQSSEQMLWITNNNDNPLPISIEAQAAVIEGEALLEGSKERYDVSDWVRFQEDTFVFKAGETKKIPFTITAPFNALPGGHYAQISIRALALQDTSNIGQGLVFPEIGIPLLIIVPGQIVEEARAGNDRVAPLFTQPHKEIISSVSIENTGTVHNLISAKLVLEKDGHIVTESVITPTLVLPSTRKKLQHTWTTPAYGAYDAYIELAYGNKGETYKTIPDKMYVTPPVSSLLTLAVAIWTAQYMWPRRRNIKAAVRTVIKSD